MNRVLFGIVIPGKIIWTQVLIFTMYFTSVTFCDISHYQFDQIHLLNRVITVVNLDHSISFKESSECEYQSILALIP